MVVGLAFGQTNLEVIDVQPEIRVGMEAGLLPVDLQLAFSQRSVEPGQGPAQVAARFTLIILWPEKGR
jgi:hypothetical protein